MVRIDTAAAVLSNTEHKVLEARRAISITACGWMDLTDLMACVLEGRQV